MSIEPSSGPDRARATATATGAAPLRPLIGRADELERLEQLLESDGPSVINVTGTRGAGKSALKRAALDRVGDRFGDVQRLDLAGESPHGLVAAIAGYATRMPIPLHRGDRDAPRSRSLLILERADVLAPFAQEVTGLATAGGSLTIIVESVSQLRATGCATLLVGPLSAEDAAALFRRAARSVGVILGRDPESIARIERVCAALDGNPLAIELAAARLSFLPLAGLETILESPHRALSVLSTPVGSSLDRPGIRSALSASQQTASTAAQNLLDLVSVFAGSFSIEAVEAVSDGVVTPCYDALGELLDLRLVELDPASDGRYRLSRLVRSFAVERLEASPLAASAHARHADYYASVAGRAAAGHENADEDAAHDALGKDYKEAFEALRWLAQNEPSAALRLAADLGWAAERRGTGDSLAAVLEELFAAAPDCDASTRRDALLTLAQLQSWVPEAGDRVELIEQRLTDALALAHELDEPLPLLRALRARFMAVVAVGDVRAAMEACTEGIEIATALGHPRWLGRFELSLASMYGHLLRYELAVPLAESGLARALRAGDRRAIVLGATVLHQFPPETLTDPGTIPSLESVLEMSLEVGDTRNATHVLSTLAHQAVERQDADAAASWVLARQENLGRAELLHGLTVSVMLAVHISRLRGDLATSARLHGSIASQAEPLLPLLNPRHVELYTATLDAVRAGIGASEYEATVAAGRMLDRDQTFAELMAYLHKVVTAPSPASEEQSQDGSAAVLSPREAQVLQLLCRGLRNKEIATELRVTDKTVMHHTVAIYRKLGVRGRAEAATTAARLGMVLVE